MAALDMAAVGEISRSWKEAYEAATPEAGAADARAAAAAGGGPERSVFAGGGGGVAAGSALPKATSDIGGAEASDTSNGLSDSSMIIPSDR